MNRKGTRTASKGVWGLREGWEEWGHEGRDRKVKEEEKDLKGGGCAARNLYVTRGGEGLLVSGPVGCSQMPLDLGGVCREIMKT